MKPALEFGQTCIVQGVEVVATKQTKTFARCDGCVNENRRFNDCDAADIPDCSWYDNTNTHVDIVYMPIDQYMIRRLKGEL